MKYEHDILTILYFSFSITFSLKGTEVILKNCFIGMESFVFTFESCLPHYCTLPTSIGQITFFFFLGQAKKVMYKKEQLLSRPPLRVNSSFGSKHLIKMLSLVCQTTNEGGGQTQRNFCKRDMGQLHWRGRAREMDRSVVVSPLA